MRSTAQKISRHAPQYSRIVNSPYSGSACKSDFDPKWRDTVSTILTLLAEKGIAELKQSSPDVFNRTFLSKQQLVIPASTLVMKGFFIH